MTMRTFLCSIFIIIAIMASAQGANVTLLEQRGNNNGVCVFSVTVPAQPQKPDGKTSLKPEEYACYEVLQAVLFKGVENYNDGLQLVLDTNDAFAKSLLNPKTRAFMTYFKKLVLENNEQSDKEAAKRDGEKNFNKYKDGYTELHYIVELNNFNLIKVLTIRGSMAFQANCAWDNGASAPCAPQSKCCAKSLPCPA